MDFKDTMTNPTISIIIPVYNGERFIRQTIESVLRQTYHNLEIIVTDDNSTDSSRQILSEFTDGRLKIVCSEKRNGVARNRNNGFKLSTGDFIAFLDQDDIWLPEKLDLQLRALLKYPNAYVAYSWMDIIDENNNKISEGYRTKSEGNVYFELLKRSFLLSMSSPMIIRKAFEEEGGFDETLDGCDDWEFLVRIAKKHYFVCVPKVLSFYRKFVHSLSFNIEKFENKFLLAAEKIFSTSSLANANLIKEEAIARFYYLLAFRAFKEKGIIAFRILDKAIRKNKRLKKRVFLILLLMLNLTVSQLPVRIVNVIYSRTSRIFNEYLKHSL